MLILLLLLVLAGAAVDIVRAPPAELLFGNASRSDFEDYFKASQGLRAGEDVYRVTTLEELRKRYRPEDLRRPEVFLEIARRLRGVGTYLYPPLMAFLLLPISALPYATAAAIFQGLSVLALWGFLAWTFARRTVSREQAPVWILSALLLTYGFLRGNFANGNIGTFLIVLCALGLSWSFAGSKALAFVGGCLLGLATVLKVTPVFLGLVLLAGQRWMALGGAVTGGLVGLGLPALGIGWAENSRLLSHWYEFIIKNFNEAVFVRPWANNQTLSAGLAKLLVPNADAEQAAVGLPLLVDASEDTVRRIATIARFGNGGLYLFSLVASLVVLWRHRSTEQMGPERGGTLLTLTTGVLLVSLVASGVSWYHAYCVLLFPVLWRLTEVAGGRGVRNEDRFLWGALAVFALIEGVLPVGARRFIALYSVFAWLMLIAAVWHLVRVIRDMRGS